MPTSSSFSKIGRYEITGQLGKGAMGVVYKATDPTIGRVVALKTARLDVHGTEAEEMLARFRNEARLAGVLKHPNIVTVYDAGDFEGLFYIAMEYIEGETLQKLLAEKRKLPPERIVILAQQVCAGLDAAAAHKVVHRDIKPANIMIETAGVAKIMDFGIAKTSDGLTSTGQVLGTPNYMSPEQVRGLRLDGRSDLFSFGVVLYEMVTGEKPFHGDNVATIIYKIIHEDPTPPREVDAAIHPVLSAIISKALAKHPDTRYQTGADLARDLTNCKAPTVAPTEPTVVLATAAPPAAAAPKARRDTREIVPAAAAKPAGKPASSTKISLPGEGQVSLLAIIGGIVLLVIATVLGVIAYVRHSQAQQRAELEQRLQQLETSSSGPAAASSKPSPSGQEPTATASQPAPAAPTAAVNPSAASRDNSTSPESGQPDSSTPASDGLATGELVLNTTPDGAQVQIDGKGSPGWRTPYTAHVAPGTHTVSFQLSGYAGETRVVELSAGGQAFVAASLKQQQAGISLQSDPPGASILLDGSDTSQVTPAQVTASPGNHVILLRKSGYGALTTTIHVTGKQSVSYSGPLPPLSKGSGLGKFKQFFVGEKTPLEVRSNPQGAQVTVDGVAQAKSTPFKTQLQPGSYDVVLKLSGYKDLHQTVTVEKDVPLEMDEVMVRQ
jgi:eukaryotic-like serine/threonine-protein kinase